MFEYHNNILCVQSSWLFEKDIVSTDLYKKLCQRNHFNKVKSGGNGRKALIEFSSMRKDIKDKIIELVGDPTETAKQITFTDYLKTDSKAETFFNTYTLPSREPLPEKNIKEYCANAAILNAIDFILGSTMSKRKALGSKVKPWEKIAPIVAALPKHQWPHSLPENERRLQQRYKKYKADGYPSLIHKLFCQKNAEKINDDAKSWVLARWSDRVNKCANYAQLHREYNDRAIQNGWKQLKTEQALQLFLQSPSIEPIWFQYRFGELKSKEKYSYQHSTRLPSMRDSLWYSDGTKLNYYYQDSEGKMKTCQVYEVFDSFSEVFLGYHISDSENFEAQYYAFKMALQISGHKPYEIKFDNQGGTKKLQESSFLGNLAKITRNTAPYNGKSKTIENAFYRFQSQFLKRDWFFTGQNITAKKDESKSNMEMILANKANLPTLQEVKEIYRKRREEWNEAPHPKTGISRLEMYLNSENVSTPEVTIWDMIDMFWITRKEQVTCTAYGITFTDKKIDHTFIVRGADGYPDLDWLTFNIDKKFTIRYDPDDMTTIQLYENTPLGLKKAGTAENKVVIFRNAQEQEDWEATFRKQMEIRIKEQRINLRDIGDENLAIHGMLPEDYGLLSPKLKGIETSRKQKTSIGQYQKIVSNLVSNEEIEIETESDIDVHSLM